MTSSMLLIQVPAIEELERVEGIEPSWPAWTADRFHDLSGIYVLTYLQTNMFSAPTPSGVLKALSIIPLTQPRADSPQGRHGERVQIRRDRGAGVHARIELHAYH
jgi:hypothetical protein